MMKRQLMSARSKTSLSCNRIERRTHRCRVYSDLYPSKYLSASDLKGKRVTATVAKVTIEEFVNDGDKQNKPVVHFKEAIKPFVANKTNVNIMAKLIGDNTDDWAGKQIGLRMELVTFKGKVTESIRVTQTDEFNDSLGF